MLEKKEKGFEKKLATNEAFAEKLQGND